MWGQLKKQLRWLSLSLAGALAVGPAWAEEQPLDAGAATPILAQWLLTHSSGEISLDEAEEVARSEYWIGVHLGDVPEIAKAQLKLEHGLATIAVLPDSPALKAGLEPHDILLRVGEKNLHEPIELVRAVNEAKDQKLKLTFLRHGKEQSIELQPAKRPKPVAGDEPVARVRLLTDGEGGPELAQLERALRALQGASTGEEGVGLWFVRPPVWASPDVRVAMNVAELPDDVQVTVQKKGSELAKVVVKRGDKVWETTEDKLDLLPEEIREPVGHLVGRRQISVQAKVLHGGTGHKQQVERHVVVVDQHGEHVADRGVTAKLDLILQKLDRLGGATTAKGPIGGSAEATKVDDRFDDLQREMQRLRKEVESLRPATKP